MQFHPIDRGAAVDNAAAADSPLLHVAQQSRRDKLRFPPAATDDVGMLPPPNAYDNDAAFPHPLDPYGARTSAADLGYLNAVVAPRTAPPAAGGEQWPTPEHGGSLWSHAKLEQVDMEYDAARPGFTAHHQGAALSLTLRSPAYGGSLQSVVGVAAAAGPLGPFTGYAAVLKGSRFLRPAQQMLDEICAALVGEERSRWNTGAGGSCSLASTTSMASSVEDGNRQHQRPEFRETKAKLLFMQEEVSRRYKQYHHQMQMLVSSFESVPGLSSGTPYASSVLKAISGHFRRVRSIISNQILYISRILGDELLSLPSCSRGGKAVAEQSQPVWRPQRGLPERAVSVLRAWLFEHFLHPYPTDGDKHMLATQTGLSRNQVSNWFINARVRLWKPMVEEIHMLETRISASTLARVASSSDRATPPAGVDCRYQMLQDQQQCQHAAPPLMMGVEVGGGGQGPMSFTSGMASADMGGGFGAAAAVSLTLGLRRDVSYQHQQQFGGHILGDLVG